MDYDTQFCELVTRAQTRGRKDTDAPISRLEIAKKLGISRAHLYGLMEGRHTPHPHVQARLVRAFVDLTGLSAATIKRRLHADWAEF